MVQLASLDQRIEISGCIGGVDQLDHVRVGPGSEQIGHGGTVGCEILDLPFYDKDKRIPRGLDKTVP